MRVCKMIATAEDHSLSSLNKLSYQTLFCRVAVSCEHRLIRIHIDTAAFGGYVFGEHHTKIHPTRFLHSCLAAKGDSGLTISFYRDWLLVSI